MWEEAKEKGVIDVTKEPSTSKDARKTAEKEVARIKRKTGVGVIIIDECTFLIYAMKIWNRQTPRVNLQMERTHTNGKREVSMKEVPSEIM